MGTLSRPEMEAAIRAKGVVMMPNGAIIARVEDLPSQGDLATLSKDPEKLKAAEADIDAQIAKLQAEKALLKPSLAIVEAPPPQDPAKKEAPKVATLVEATVAPANVVVVPTPAQAAKPTSK